jgi:hypothetical protein
VTIAPSQCKAARELIGWTQGRLATAVGVSRATIHKGCLIGLKGRSAPPSNPPASNSSRRAAAASVCG